MHSYLANPLEFLISTLFSLYILAVMLRFLLGVVRADFYNPVSQFLVRITNPLLVPMRKVLPGIGKIDTSAIVLMLVLQLLSLADRRALRGVDCTDSDLLLVAVGELVHSAINVLLVAIIVQVMVSWVNPGSYNPVNAVLLQPDQHRCCEPIQRLLPPLAGIDLSPLFVP